MLPKDPIMTLLARAMDAEALRQRVIANNIANLNTPGFKRSRVDFQALLSAAQGEPSTPLKQTDKRHFPGVGGGAVPGVEQVNETSMRADGNNVDLEREMIELVENALNYQAIVQLRSIKSNIRNYVIRSGR